MASFRKLLFAFILLLFLQLFATAQKTPLYKNKLLPIPVRVKDLISRMTPEEKFWQLFMIPGDPGTDSSKYHNGLFGFQVSAASASSDAAGQLLNYSSSENALTLAKKINRIQHYFVDHTRLGIPMIAFDESLHGLVRSGATSFPQAIALAATWDVSLMQEVASAIAVETKVRGIRQVLTPVINTASDVRWGRTEETYGEDPYLTSQMAIAFIRPFEKAGIITTPKHFLANVGDGGRDSYPVHFNERILREIYLPPFKAAIEQGGARSVMTSYNSLDGSPATANDWLLNKLLKKEWGFKGFVISDASAVGGANVLHYTASDYADAGAKAITNGLDVIFQTSFDHHTLFIPPFLNGKIDRQRIDDAVGRVLAAKFELGLFDAPYVDEQNARAWVDNKSHKEIARKAALESMVLLKNEDNILPFSKSMRSVAVIGSDAVEARLGGYSGPGNGKINILEGIKERAGSNVQVNYAEGAGRQEQFWHVIDQQFLTIEDGGKEVHGLKGAYFSSLMAAGQPLFTRTDSRIDFNWTLFSPDNRLAANNYSVRWTGILQSPKTGRFKIGLDGNDGFRLYINDSLIVDRWQKQSYHTALENIDLVKDEQYKIRVEFFEAAGNAHIHLVWNVGISDSTEAKISEAVNIARQSDVTLIVTGIKEGEFQDRASLDLPGTQEKMILEIAKTGKPVIILLTGGSAITMQHWIDSVKGVVDAWYPGEEGGHAVAAVLFGDYNPSGRLPITFPLSVAQLPLVYNHKPTGRGDDYNDLSGLPLFPFGYGLSYTQFEYSGIRLNKKQVHSNETARVYCTVTNTGSREGDEVVQLYIRDVLASVARPVLELKGFQRIHLPAGEKKEISFAITPVMLQMLNDKMKTVIEPGDFSIMIGSSSRELWLKEMLTVVK